MNWPVELSLRSFAPRDVAKLTEIDPTRQRWIASRHLDFRSAPTGEDTEAGDKKRWFWDGIIALTAFEEIAADLSLARAEAALRSAVDEDLFAQDLRQHDDGEVFIAINLGDAASRIGDGIATLADVDFAFIAGDRPRPSRVYLYNLSDLQRRLAERLEAFDTVNAAAA